jgi:Bifunctional DNA primase/polymerase, N-terminal
MIARVQPRETNVVSESAVDLAQSYLRPGWQPVPIDRGQKRPRDNSWQSLAITEANVEDYFGNDDNVGVQLGARSSGLTDVDIDCAEALDLADYILPATGAIFGRRSKPRSHRLYVTDLYTTEQKATIRFAEPPTLSNGQESATLVELRIGGGDKGAQTVAPGSVHPSGEKVRWDKEGKPTSVR